MKLNRAIIRLGEGNVWTGLSWQERSLIGVAVFGCAGATYLLSSWLRWPVTPGYQVSLLAGPSAVMGLLVALLAILVSTVLSIVIVREVEFEAGFLCAAAGLGILSLRGGTVGNLLRSGGAGVYGWMILETLLLAGILWSAWVLLNEALRRGLLADELSSVASENSAPIGQKFVALLISVAVTIIVVTILAQTDAKKQVLWAVGIGSCVGALVGHQMTPVRPSLWFWTAPLVTGLIGYTWALASPGNAIIGVPANPMASAAPLDYASVGVVGAILGYWISRRWHANKGLEE